MALYDLVRDLPLEIEDVDFDICERVISPEFTRRTTVVKLRYGVTIRGADYVGVGEDVTYDPREHEPHMLAWVDLKGSWTVDSLSKRLDELDLFPKGEPAQPAYRDYRRWAFESAALDLALLQSRRSLGAVVEREARPLNFVSSTRAASLDGWLALYPTLRFKLDPTPDWTDETVAVLAARGNVDVADLKGAYHGTSVDNPPNPELYRRVAEGLPDAWIEDPALTPETDAVLEPHRDRITWDAPIHSWADVEALPFEPRSLNSKPSRFGSVERLFEFYDRCAERGISLYGGGQFELNIGRDHIQLLAGLFHPDGPNDVAPGGYNSAGPAPGSRRARSTRAPRGVRLPPCGILTPDALAARDVCRLRRGPRGHACVGRATARSLRPDHDRRRLDGARSEPAEGEAEDGRKDADLHLHCQEEDGHRHDQQGRDQGRLRQEREGNDRHRGAHARRRGRRLFSERHADPRLDERDRGHDRLHRLPAVRLRPAVTGQDGRRPALIAVTGREGTQPDRRQDAPRQDDGVPETCQTSTPPSTCGVAMPLSAGPRAAPSSGWPRRSSRHAL